MSISSELPEDKSLWKEKDLFHYLTNCCYPDLQKSRKQMARWDCYSISSAHRIELKCRTKHYETLMIEKPKYEAMLEKCNDHFDIPIYINSTPQGVYRFNLYNVTPEWEVKYYSKTTEFSQKHKVPKEVAFLDVIDAEIL